MPALLNASSEAAQLWVKESVALPVIQQGFGRPTPKGGLLCCMNLKLYPNNDRTRLSNFTAHLNVTLYWWRSFKFSFFWLRLQVAINILLAQDLTLLVIVTAYVFSSGTVLEKCDFGKNYR